MFLIFLTIAIIVFGSINYYVYARLKQAIGPHPEVKKIFRVVFIVLALSFLMARLIERIDCCLLSDVMVWVGSVWMAVAGYYLLCFLVADGIRVSLMAFRGLAHLHLWDLKAARVVASMATIVMLVTVIGGMVNAVRLRVTRQTIAIDKVGPGSSIRVVLASDIHMGTIVSGKRFSRIIDTINELEPDLILLAGDILDEDLKPVIERNLGEKLKTLSAPLGVWACTGNHEYIGGKDAAVAYLMAHGVNVLQDSVREVVPGLILVGRNDVSGVRFGGVKRLPLVDIMEGVNRSAAIVVMDHQPAAHDEASDQGADLVVSGHTHNGQLWPGNFMARRVFPLAYGFGTIGKTQAYTSSGAGTWGPPVRVGSIPEVVLLTLTFKKS